MPVRARKRIALGCFMTRASRIDTHRAHKKKPGPETSGPGRSPPQTPLLIWGRSGGFFERWGHGTKKMHNRGNQTPGKHFCTPSPGDCAPIMHGVPPPKPPRGRTALQENHQVGRKFDQGKTAHNLAMRGVNTCTQGEGSLSSKRGSSILLPKLPGNRQVGASRGVNNSVPVWMSNRVVRSARSPLRRTHPSRDPRSLQAVHNLAMRGRKHLYPR